MYGQPSSRDTSWCLRDRQSYTTCLSCLAVWDGLAKAEWRGLTATDQRGCASLETYIGAENDWMRQVHGEEFSGPSRCDRFRAVGCYHPEKGMEAPSPGRSRQPSSALQPTERACRFKILQPFSVRLPYLPHTSTMLFSAATIDPVPDASGCSRAPLGCMLLPRSVSQPTTSQCHHQSSGESERAQRQLLL